MNLLLISGLLSSLVATSAGDTGDAKNVVGVNPEPAGIRVVEEKCLECHNRQRIDEAARQRRNMEEVLRKMEGHGAVLTPPEREVMGHFWQQNPLKSTK